MTTAPVHVEPAIDAPRPAGELPPELQVGRPLAPELPAAVASAPGTEASDLDLLSARLMHSGLSPSAAPPLGVPAPLPHYARERPPLPDQRNVTIRGGQLAPAPMAYEVSVRPSSIDPGLLQPVPLVAPAPAAPAAPVG